VKRIPVLVAALAIVLSSCGLKVPVSIVAGDQQDVANPLAAASQGAGGPNTTTSLAPGVDPNSIGPSGVPTTGPAAGVGKYDFSSETEGVTKDQITLCTHVPITGAAPIPHNSARFGQFYFDYVNKELGGINGRRVRFLAYDDQYYPAGARAAMEKCRQQGTFIYLGAAGTDQIVSVAKWAEQHRVPYLHGPTSDRDLGGFKYEVELGPNYEYQSRLLADYQYKRFGNKVNYAMLRINSPYFDAAHDAYVSQLKKYGIKLKVDRVVQKDEKQFQDIFYQLSSTHVGVINNFTTPNIWLTMLNQMPPGYNPWWTAISPVAGFNIVAAALSKAHAKAVVFSHFNPACHCTYYNTDLDTSLKWAADEQNFLKIFRKYSPEQNPPPDDFDYSAYLAAKGLQRILLALGPSPTRTALFDLLATYKESAAVTFPACPGDFTVQPGSRRGGWKVNVFELDTDKWKQIESCVDKP
jgi:branched-chain amino acid transport system substrate-binding protein